MKMKYLSGLILISFEIIFTAQAVVFKRYSVINGAKAEGTGRTIPRIDQGFKCCLECENDPNCTAVNHNADTKTCELLYRQTNKLFALATAEDWDAYFKNLKDVDLLSNAVASQSSTYCSTDIYWKPIAGLAIDGNSNGGFHGASCTHTETTGIRWWMVDFKSQFSVSSVVLWNRLDAECNADGQLKPCWSRLRDLRLTVGNTLPALNDDYNLCSYYTGPPSSVRDNPVRINCSRILNGRYLKIEKEQPETEPLAICEVEVVQ